MIPGCLHGPTHQLSEVGPLLIRLHEQAEGSGRRISSGSTFTRGMCYSKVRWASPGNLDEEGHSLSCLTAIGDDPGWEPSVSGDTSRCPMACPPELRQVIEAWQSLHCHVVHAVRAERLRGPNKIGWCGMEPAMVVIRTDFYSESHTVAKLLVTNALWKRAFVLSFRLGPNPSGPTAPVAHPSRIGRP